MIPNVDVELRIVMNLPLRELWRDDGFITAAREKSLTGDDVGQFLASGPVQFVVADVGAPIRWIPAGECFGFWKNEAKSHLASPAGASLAEFPGGYCYFASQWKARESEETIIVLEKHH
jgi:hypothetical protein